MCAFVCVCVCALCQYRTAMQKQDMQIELDVGAFLIGAFSLKPFRLEANYTLKSDVTTIMLSYNTKLKHRNSRCIK